MAAGREEIDQDGFRPRMGLPEGLDIRHEPGDLGLQVGQGRGVNHGHERQPVGVKGEDVGRQDPVDLGGPGQAFRRGVPSGHMDLLCRTQPRKLAGGCQTGKDRRRIIVERFRGHCQRRPDGALGAGDQQQERSGL